MFKCHFSLPSWQLPLKAGHPKFPFSQLHPKKYTIFSKIYFKLWTVSILSATDKGYKMNNHESQELTWPTSSSTVLQ